MYEHSFFFQTIALPYRSIKGLWWIAWVLVFAGCFLNLADESGKAAAAESLWQNNEDGPPKELAARQGRFAPNQADSADQLSSNFRRYLRHWDQDQLVPQWALANWQQSRRYLWQLKQAWVVAAWAERELSTSSIESFRKDHPSLFQGTHLKTDSYALLKFLLLRKEFQSLQRSWIEHRFNGISDGVSIETADDWRQLIAQLRSLEPSLQAIFRFSNQSKDLDLRSKIANLRANLDSMMAWSLMIHWDVSKQNLRRVEDLASSRDLFLKSIGLPAARLQEESLKEELESLNPKSRIHLLGLGLTLSYLKQWAPANTCFQTQFENNALKERLQSRAIQSVVLANAGRWDDVNIVAAETFKKLNHPASIGNYCVLVVKGIRPLLKQDKSKDATIKFLNDLYRVLISRNQFDVVVRLVEIVKVSPDRSTLFGRLYDIDVSSRKNQFAGLADSSRKEIESKLVAFLKSNHPDLTDPLKVWCYYQLGLVLAKKDDLKATQYLQSGMRLVASQHPMAAVIRWNWVRRSYRIFQQPELNVVQKKQLKQQILNQVSSFLKDYSNTELAGVVKVYQILVGSDGDYQRIVARLKMWGAEQSGFLFARQNLLAVMHQRWLGYFSDSAAKQALAKDILNLCKQIDALILIPEDNPTKRRQQQLLRFQVRSVAVDVLNQIEVVPEESREWMMGLAEISGSELLSNGTENQLEESERVWNFQVQLTKAWNRIGAHRKVIDFGERLEKNTQIRKSIPKKQYKDLLIVQTEAYEELLQQLWSKDGNPAFVEQRKKITERGIVCYDRLGQQLFSKDPEKRDLNQLVYLAVRSSNWLSKLGKRQQAIKKLSWADQTLPGKLSIQFPLAKELQLHGSHKQAREFLGKVIPGLKPGSQKWMEAKVCLIESLVHTDPDAANTELKMIRSLFPGAIGPWETQLKRIEESLKNNQ